MSLDLWVYYVRWTRPDVFIHISCSHTCQFCFSLVWSSKTDQFFFIYLSHGPGLHMKFFIYERYMYENVTSGFRNTIKIVCVFV